MDNTTWRQKRLSLLQKVTRMLEGPMVLLGFVWLALLVVELTWGLSPGLEWVVTIIWVLFLFDFFIKLIISPNKKKFISRNWLTILSLLIPALRVFRALRFVRLLRGIRGVRLVKILGTLNRGMRSLSATMKRRGFAYVFLLTLAVLFAGAAGMLAFEKDTGGITHYGNALWWTAMMLITSGSEYWPQTPEGRMLGFLLALYGFTIFGYITATLASFFVGRDAEEQDAPVAGAVALRELHEEVQQLRQAITELKTLVAQQNNRPG